MSRHPAFASGRDAFRKGNLVNPNKEGTIANKEWTAGFDHEYFINLKDLQSNTKGTYYA